MSSRPTYCKLAPKSPVTREEDDNDTEPDLKALVAFFEDSQPDPPHAKSVYAESIVDQEVSKNHPTVKLFILIANLGGSQLFSEGAEHVLAAPKVGNRHLVFGSTLAPADTFLEFQAGCTRGHSRCSTPSANSCLPLVMSSENWRTCARLMQRRLGACRPTG